MPAILPGFEYDIFISYRHNDNRSGTVSALVNHIKEELAATIKSPLSIYFDTNPYDGLLENHDVDRSLARKLRSLIFIPILSQTYCDQDSFAWRNEFCAFNDQAKGDNLGIDVKLNNGNIASRVLPIKIHDLDQEDIDLIERETGRTLRAIDFIFKSAGVNRPLQIDDRREQNDNKLYYRDQVNKVANAVKELLYGIQYPDRVQSVPIVKEQVNNEPRTQGSIETNAVAVLPFRNLANDPSREYFAEGIMENIIMQLSCSKNLRVISRTSVMRYKNTDKTAPEISSELGVKYILEGSAQAHGNKVRINTQLIEAQKDETVWSKVFVENLDDIFEIQTKVAEQVAAELQGSLEAPAPSASKAPTSDPVAYDLFLKGRHAFNQWGVDGYKAASEYFKQALERDPEFQQAYSYLASSYSARMSWNGDLSPAEAVEQINVYLEEAWQRGATDNDYLTRAFVEFFVTKDFENSEAMLQKALSLNSNNSMVYYTYSYLLNMMGRHAEAAEMVTKAKAIDPLTVAFYNYQTIGSYLLGDYDSALATLAEALKLYPTVIRLYDFQGRVYLTIKDFSKAKQALEKGLGMASIRPPSMVAYLAMAQLGLNNPEAARRLLDELINRSNKGEKGVNFYLVHIYASMQDFASARHWLSKATQTNDIDLIWLEVDPLLKDLPGDAPERSDLEADFKGAEAHVLAMLEEKLPPLDYHNLGHIDDVLESAMKIAATENISAEERQLLRLAALYHDAGFIYQADKHEEKSAEIARQELPAFGLSESQIELICGMIMATKIPQQPTTQLERIIADADLDYLGRDDFAPISQGLFEEYKKMGLVDNEREWNLVQKMFFEAHQFHTEFSKAHRQDVKQRHLEEILARLKSKE